MRDDQYKLMYHGNPELGKEYTTHAVTPKVSPIPRPGYKANVHVDTCTIDGFHGAWLHFRRARVGVCV